MPINHSAAVGGSASSLRSAAAYTGAVYNLNERYESKLDERFKTFFLASFEKENLFVNSLVG